MLIFNQTSNVFQLISPDYKAIQIRLLKCVEAKEELESELYKRFILVLNEKKAKIRSLQQSLKEAEEVIEEATQKREVVPTSERKVEDYDGSTDEESENCIQSSIVVPGLAMIHSQCCYCRFR
uniref:Uncharacterized protein n=1 Tax=Sphaerodactylus townsendi TaxID=933632 RepID=A0ACB8EQZ4_9SAUR